MKKSDLQNNSLVPPICGDFTVSEYVQNKDRKSFDRSKFHNVVPTIGGIDTRDLIVT